MLHLNPNLTRPRFRPIEINERSLGHSFMGSSHPPHHRTSNSPCGLSSNYPQLIITEEWLSCAQESRSTMSSTFVQPYLSTQLMVDPRHPSTYFIRTTQQSLTTCATLEPYWQPPRQSQLIHYFSLSTSHTPFHGNKWTHTYP